MKLTEEQLVEYQKDPLGKGAALVRGLFRIPETRYFSITTYPEKVRGTVMLTGVRELVVKKISKSDQ
jgi:hypothetical protein